jgi:excisionase family DNA binding protein
MQKAGALNVQSANRGLPVEGNRHSNRSGPKLIMEKLLLTPEEAAKLLGIGRSRVYDLMRAHALLSVKIGRSRRVPVASLHEYVAALAREGEYE